MGALLRGLSICYDELVEQTDVPGLDVLPASADLWALDLEADKGAHTYRAVMNMRDALEEDGAYDVMVIDCPPNLSAACVSAILASDAVIIPVLSDACSSTGVADLVEQIDSLRYIRPEIRVAGVLINQWHNSPVVEQGEALLRSMPLPVFKQTIRRTDKVPESTFQNKPVLDYSTTSAASRDYRLLAKELFWEVPGGE
nr:ParA family protein [Flavonifractor sp. An9]